PASSSPLSGSQCSSLAFAGVRRTMRSTCWSAVRSAVTRAEPIRPDEPAIATVKATIQALLETEVGLERAFFETMSDGGQEPSGVGAVDQPVVVGQREIADGPHSDRFVAGVVDDDTGSFDDGPGAQHRSLRRYQDGSVHQRALAADVGDGERPAGQLVGLEVTGPGAAGDVGDRARQPGQRQVTGVVDEGGEQALLGVDCKAEMLGV